MGRKRKNRASTAPRKRRDSKPKTSPQSRKAPAKKKKTTNIAVPVLDAGKLKELYATMVKCRMLAEHVYARPSSRNLPGIAPLGGEAMLVGAGAHLLAQDCVVLAHGGCVASLIKGTPLRSILARIPEVKKTNGLGPAEHAGGGAHTPQLNMAGGLSLSREMKDKGAVTLIFCAPDAASLVFDPRAMALAATEKLPLVCVAESGLPADPDARAARPATVDSAYYPRIVVDACDVVAVFRVAQEAVRRARQGHGPALIECVTARTEARAGNSHAPAEDDPVLFMEHYLRRRGLWSDEWARLIADGFARELDAAFAAMPEPAGADGQFDNVYSSDARSRPAELQARPVPAQ
jgi:acetoin:2,6-dichlorophenolindophenol oxidoreductase subunit alpha